MYAESSWIFIMTVVQFGGAFCSANHFLLRDTDTNASYLGFVLVLWTSPRVPFC